MKRALWHVIMAAVVLGMLACVTAVSAAEVTVIKITMKEFSFTPKSVTVAGGQVRFVLTNGGTIEHDFMIDALGVNSGIIKPGATVTVPAAGKPPLVLKKGTYQAYCMVPGHKDIGMIATIVVK